MHTVDLLRESLQVIQQLGYRVRQDWLDGEGGAVCTIRGEKWLFLDISESHADQFQGVLRVLQSELEREIGSTTLSISEALREKMELKKAA